MGLIRTRALLLRRSLFKNTSYILDLFTEELGKVSLIAQGARREKSQLMGRIDYNCELEVVFIDKKQGMGLLTESSILTYHPSIHTDRGRLGYAFLFFRFLREFLENRVEEGELFSHACRFLDQLGQAAGVGMSLLYQAALLDILACSGFRPEVSRCNSCNRELTTERRWFTIDGQLLGSCCQGQKSGKKSLELSAKSVNIIKFIQNGDTVDVLSLDVSASDLAKTEMFVLGFTSTILKKNVFIINEKNYHVA